MAGERDEKNIEILNRTIMQLKLKNDNKNNMINNINNYY